MSICDDEKLNGANASTEANAQISCPLIVMPQLKNNLNSVATKIEKAKRWNAFIVTSLCAFLLVCLLWSLSVSEFRSVACINISIGKDDLSVDQFESMLARVIQVETVDERLEELIEQIEVSGNLTSNRLEFRDFESIRSSFQVSITERDYGYDYCLGLDGSGSLDEQALLQSLISRVATRLRPANSHQAARSANRNSTANTLSKIQSDQIQAIDRANQMVNRIDEDLASVKQALASMGDSNAGLANRSTASGSGNQFQLASSQKVVADQNRVSTGIELIDLQSLRGILGEIKERMDLQAKLIRRNTMDQAAQRASTQLIVSNPNQIITRPRHGRPGHLAIFLMGMISIALGSVVAIKLKPFESRGFENSRSIGRTLGVPVVAQIRASATDAATETPAPTSWWANRVATGSSLILLAAVVVIGGFIVINPEVRIAFLENPFYGVSKIVRVFAGYS